MKQLILAEDDCAPDAREYFDKDMVKLTGLTSHQFQRDSIASSPDEGYTMFWKKDGWTLTGSADHPWLQLYRETE